MAPGEERIALSDHELAILTLIAEGQTTKQAARAMMLSPRTVERHIEICRQKLHARNKTHLVAKAMANGYLAGYPRLLTS
jgi:two-component system response regulator NreC